MDPCNPSAAKIARKERKTDESSSDEETTAMDQQIWKDLPEELLENVIARLPIITMMRFRSVCRKWDWLLSKSPNFHRKKQNQPLIYALVRGADNVGALYDPLVKKWYYITYCQQVSDPGGIFWGEASAGGLVCYVDVWRKSFLVGNHLTHTWKEWQWPGADCESSLSNYSFAMELIIPNQDYSVAGGYKIVWVNKNGEYGVCDSLKKMITTWRIPANLQLHSSLAERGVTISNVVYFWGRKPDGLLSYDIMSEKWEQFLIPSPPNSKILSLAECDGRLLLVGLVDSVCIWELEMEKRCWIEVDRMPSSCYFEFRFKPSTVLCMGIKRLLVMQIKAFQCNQREVPAYGIFTYDVVSRVWSKVPDCIPPGHTEPQKIMVGVEFFPCLFASP